MFSGRMVPGPEELQVVEDMQAETRVFDAKAEIIGAGDDIRATHVLRSGWAIRCRALSDGRRQILSFVLPGDIVGLHINFKRQATFGLQTLTKAGFALCGPHWVNELYVKHPMPAAAMGWSTVRSSPSWESTWCASGAGPPSSAWRTCCSRSASASTSSA
jgi:hypothetical protein